MLESLRSSFEPKEHQEINLDDFMKNLNTSQLKIKNIQQVENQDKRIEEKELLLFESYFNWKLDFDNFTNQLNITKQNNKQINQYEVKQNIQENSEKEKLLIYSKLADLSYIHLKTNLSKKWNKSFEFETVSLDPTSFEHINTLFDSPNIATLTEDELFLYKEIQKNKNKTAKPILAKNSEIENILEMAWLDKQLLASNIWFEWVFDWSKALKRFLLLMWLKILVEKKEQEAKNNFANLKEDYEILDYFPNETKWDKDSSWFWAIFLEKDWKKYIAIRWTEWLNDWKDLYADWKMVLWKAPWEQIKAMTDFIDRCITIPWEKFSIVWHSLWWTLSQIWTAIYVDKIKETYTFNSPWAKKLKVADDDLEEFAKFKEFVHNRDSKRVWELITNVVWKKWFAPISDLWVDIWENEIHLKYLRSHSITATSEYIDKLPSDSPELIKVKIEFDIKKKSDRHKE